jgi:hypothetical protein
MSERRSCAYCGSFDDLTDDHVPPKNLFPPPRPQNLITVYACKKCHAPTNKDDEYFRQVVCISEQAGDHPDAQRNIQKVLRSLQNPKAPGLKKSFFSSLKNVWLKSPGGLFLGRGVAYTVDTQRIFRVVERTVRGLFFYETGRRIPDGCEVVVHCNDTLVTFPPDVLETLTEQFLIPLAQATQKVIGDDVFSYRFLFAADDPSTSAWALTFYKTVPFFALVARRNGQQA